MNNIRAILALVVTVLAQGAHAQSGDSLAYQCYVNITFEESFSGEGDLDFQALKNELNYTTYQLIGNIPDGGATRGWSGFTLKFKSEGITSGQATTVQIEKGSALEILPQMNAIKAHSKRRSVEFQGCTFQRLVNQ